MTRYFKLAVEIRASRSSDTQPADVVNEKISFTTNSASSEEFEHIRSISFGALLNVSADIGRDGFDFVQQVLFVVDNTKSDQDVTLTTMQTSGDTPTTHLVDAGDWAIIPGNIGFDAVIVGSSATEPAVVTVHVIGKRG